MMKMILLPMMAGIYAGYVTVGLLCLLGFAVLGAWLGGLRNRGTEGIVLCLLLGPLGLLITVLLPEKPYDEVRITRNTTPGGGLSWRNTAEGKRWAKEQMKKRH